MPLFHIRVLRDDRVIREDVLRAPTEERAGAAAQLRYMSCRPGESLVLLREGTERARLGPRPNR